MTQPLAYPPHLMHHHITQGSVSFQPLMTDDVFFGKIFYLDNGGPNLSNNICEGFLGFPKIDNTGNESKSDQPQ